MNKSKRRTVSVLLVDDDAALLRSLARSLSELGFQVETATSAATAAAVMNQVQIDVVICDQKMPGQTGLELLSQLTINHPNLIMMMLSGEICGVTHAEGKADELGVAELFTKPCDANLIAGRIRYAIQSRESVSSNS